MRYALWHPGRGWLMDTCAGGTWTQSPMPDIDADLAIEFGSKDAAWAALDADEIERGPHVVVPLCHICRLPLIAFGGLFCSAGHGLKL